MPPRVLPRQRLEKLALKDGIGHLQLRTGRARALCGAPRIDPRFAYPVRADCGECLVRAPR